MFTWCHYLARVVTSPLRGEKTKTLSRAGQDNNVIGQKTFKQNPEKLKLGRHQSFTEHMACATCRLESLIPGASRFTLAPYDTSTVATTSTSRTGSNTRSVQPAGGEVVSQVQKKVQECFLTGKCWTWYSKKDLMKNSPKIGAVVAFNVYIGAKPNLRDGNLVTKKVNA